MKSVFVLLTAASLAWPALAAPPETPGHLPRSITPDMLLPKQAPAPSELPHRGKVVNLIESEGGYAYVEVAQGEARRWIAGPATPLKVGDTVAFSDGPVMTDFYSKTLNRAFPSMLFADHVALVPAP